MTKTHIFTAVKAQTRITIRMPRDTVSYKERESKRVIGVNFGKEGGRKKIKI